ncbi:hypothetical protein IG631_05953 [Alternaria alternata]|nr:hypothetical protein IG631_05953 [Alternaria alternata]
MKAIHIEKFVSGLHQNNRRHVQPPFTLGTEFSGVVTHSPEDCSFKPGDRVFGGGLGAYAEQICVPEDAVRRVPSQWTNAEACAVGASGAVSYGALLSVAQLQAGETVLVLGASGGLGVMAVQIAKAIGCKVIAVVGGSEKGGVVKGIGADVIVDYGDEGWENRVREATNGGEGVDVVYDGIGAVESGIKCLKYRGRLVVVGFAARNGSIENRFGEDGRRDPQRTKDVWDGFIKLVDDGKIRPIIYKEEYAGLETVSKALEDVKARKAWGRSVVRICDEKQMRENGGQKARL